MSRQTFAKRSGAQETRESWKDARYETRALKDRNLGDKAARKRKVNAERMFEFQLYRGEDKYPKIKEMTINEMIIENKIFIESFTKSDELGKKRALWTWKKVE